MNKILSVLLLLIISFFVIGCSSKFGSDGYYRDTKILTEVDIKELSETDKEIILTFINQITNKKFYETSFSYKLNNNQIIRNYESRYPDSSKVNKIDDYWISNAQIFITMYLENKKEAEKLFIEIKNTKFDKSKINMITGNLSSSIREHILKNMRVIENPNINSMNFENEFKEIIWSYLAKEYGSGGDYASGKEKFRNYMINRYAFSPVTIYFLNEYKMLTVNDLKNESINIDITSSTIDLTRSEQAFENEDLKITTFRAIDIPTDIRWIHYVNKTDKYINIKTTSLYLGENIYHNSSFLEISLSPFAKTTTTINFLNKDYSDRSIPPSVKVKVADLEQTNINFGYAVKYEINGKEKTFIKTKFLTYKDFK